jgi:hypothetical protein
MIKRWFAALIVGLFIFTPYAGAANGLRTTTAILSLSNDANGCFADQTPGGAVAITLDGVLVTSGVCIHAAAQQIAIEGGDNNAGVDVVIVGTNADGSAQTETLTLSNGGTATSVYYYKTITSITTDGATAGNIEGGPLSTNGAVSETLTPDLVGHDPLMSIATLITGTMTYTIEHTSFNMPSAVVPVWFDTLDLAGKTASAEGNIVAPVGGVRINISAYTSGTAQLMILQARRP